MSHPTRFSTPALACHLSSSQSVSHIQVIFFRLLLVFRKLPATVCFHDPLLHITCSLFLQIISFGVMSSALPRPNLVPLPQHLVALCDCYLCTYHFYLMVEIPSLCKFCFITISWSSSFISVPWPLLWLRLLSSTAHLVSYKKLVVHLSASLHQCGTQRLPALFLMNHANFLLKAHFPLFQNNKNLNSLFHLALYLLRPAMLLQMSKSHSFL